MQVLVEVLVEVEVEVEVMEVKVLVSDGGEKRWHNLWEDI